jgi:FAD/FMN-containing dehydrogenase
VRKDVTGYDLKSLLIGSEGTLGIVTAAWLRFLPAPEAALPVVGLYRGTRPGCAAIERVVGSGLLPAALEYLDARTVAAAGTAFPGSLPAGTAFMVIAEADGSRDEAVRLRDELAEVLSEEALDIVTPEPAQLWRWREGVAFAVTSLRGGKSGEDVVVPLDRLAEAIEETVEIGRRHDLAACSWGHAGDGNVHANFVIDPRDQAELNRARAGAEELFAMAIRLGGSISGEHGIGFTKRGWLERQWAPRAVELHHELKRTFDPKGLLNPGKKD